MKKPKVFMKTFGVLNIGMGVIVALYTGMGFFGYIRYGGAIEGSITFSLGEPLALANAVQILLAIAIFFTHPIQCYVAIDIIWNEYIAPNLEKNSHKLLWEYVVRTSLVLLTCKWTSVRVLHPMWRQFQPGIEPMAGILIAQHRLLFSRVWRRVAQVSSAIFIFTRWLEHVFPFDAFALTSQLNYPFRGWREVEGIIFFYDNTETSFFF